MEKFDAVLEFRVSADAWHKAHKARELATTAAKAAEAEWQLLGLPCKGEDYAKKAKLNDGQTAQVVVRDLNGNPLSAGKLSQRTNPPREALTFWVSPRL